MRKCAQYVMVSPLDWTSDADKQRNLPVNREGYNLSETTVRKLSAMRINWYCEYFHSVFFVQDICEQETKNNQTEKTHNIIECTSSKALVDTEATGSS